MSFIDGLKEEHRVIERLLKVLTISSERLEKGEAISPAVFRRVIDFVRNFMDKCHGGKEEDILFRAIELHGIPRQGGPTGVMFLEHEEGRKFLRNMEDALNRYEAGDRSTAGAIARNGKGLAQLFLQHIPKEDDILYPLAENIFRNANQHKEFLEKFERIERERIGEGKHQEYVKLVEELERELGL